MTFIWIGAALAFAVLGATGAALLMARARIAALHVQSYRAMLAGLEMQLGAGRDVGVHPLRRIVRQYLQRSTDPDEVRGWITAVAVGLLLISIGGLLLTLISSTVLHDPREAALAQASLNEATTRPAPPGRSFAEVVAAFVDSRRTQYGYEVRAIDFRARRREPLCSNQKAAACSSNNPSRLVGAWAGDLVWEERRSPSQAWVARSCPATVVRTVEEGWRLEGTRRCDYPSS